MNEPATEMQRMLEDALARLAQREYDFERRRRASSPGDFDAARWRLLCDIGLAALLVPQAHGGLEAPVADALHALRVLGPSLVPEPVLASCVLATRLLARAGGEAAAHWLPRLAEGGVGTIAAFEPGADFELMPRGSQARLESGQWVLDGDKTLVAQAVGAELLLVSARLPDGDGAWFAVPAPSPGISLRGYALLDGQRAADVRLRDVRVARAARLDGDAAQATAELRDLWLAAVCADAVGVMQAALDATVAYLNTRVQFGQPLAAQQALRHRATSMWLELEQARSLAWLAGERFDLEPPPRRARLLAATKARVGQACREVAQQAVQLHGGIGLSDELQLSHWFKRLTLADLWLGDDRTQLRRYAAMD